MARPRPTGWAWFRSAIPLPTSFQLPTESSRSLQNHAHPVGLGRATHPPFNQHTQPNGADSICETAPMLAIVLAENFNLLHDLGHGRLTDSGPPVQANCPRNHESRGCSRLGDNWPAPVAITESEIAFLVTYDISKRLNGATPFLLQSNQLDLRSFLPINFE